MVLKVTINPETTRSVNASATLVDSILDYRILDDNTPVLQATRKFIAKSMQNIYDFGNWLLDYILPNQW